MSYICLLIDDDADDQFLFLSALEDVDPSLSCRVESSGSIALEKLQRDESFTPDLIFLDLNMPGLNGKQCLARLRNIKRLKEVPIIIYSTSNYPGDVLETKQLGALGYVVKPSGYEAIKQTIRKVFSTHLSHTTI